MTLIITEADTEEMESSTIDALHIKPVFANDELLDASSRKKLEQLLSLPANLVFEINREDILHALLDQLAQRSRQTFAVISDSTKIIQQTKDYDRNITTGLFLGKKQSLKDRAVDFLLPGRRKDVSGADYLVAKRSFFTWSPSRRGLRSCFIWDVDSEKELVHAMQNPSVLGVITEEKRKALRARKQEALA